MLSCCQYPSPRARAVNLKEYTPEGSILRVDLLNSTDQSNEYYLDITHLRKFQIKDYIYKDYKLPLEAKASNVSNARGLEKSHILEESQVSSKICDSTEKAEQTGMVKRFTRFLDIPRPRIPISEFELKREPIRCVERVFSEGKWHEIEVDLPPEEITPDERDQAWLRTLPWLYPPARAAELRARYRPREPSDPPTRPTIPMTLEEVLEYNQRCWQAMAPESDNQNDEP